MKTLTAKEAWLTHPNFKKILRIQAKFNHALEYQKKENLYTTNYGELLSIVETLKVLRNILLRQVIILHDDHENLK
jgi:hypothetical protein